jgi:hypothetical protein
LKWVSSSVYLQLPPQVAGHTRTARAARRGFFRSHARLRGHPVCQRSPHQRRTPRARARGSGSCGAGKGSEDRVSVKQAWRKKGDAASALLACGSTGAVLLEVWGPAPVACADRPGPTGGPHRPDSGLPQ